MDQSEHREDGAPPSKTTDPPKAQRPAPGPSCVSFKSDESMFRLFGFKSDDSKDRPIEFKIEHSPQPAPGPRQVSFKSDDSMDHLIDFKTERGPQLDPAGVHWIRPGLRKYFCELTLDPNTAHRRLKLSDNNKKVTRVKEKQPYPDHQDRFEIWEQLLCSTSLTGRCYWEVQWSGDVSISVSYRGIGRKGYSGDCVFGYNDQSWSLSCSEGGYYVRHNKNQTPLPHSLSSSGTVAVYVDCPAGSLSFYTVSSDQLTHLHTFNTTFTQTLFPGFELWSVDSSVSLLTLWD